MAPIPLTAQEHIDKAVEHQTAADDVEGGTDAERYRLASARNHALIAQAMLTAELVARRVVTDR